MSGAPGHRAEEPGKFCAAGAAARPRPPRVAAGRPFPLCRSRRPSGARCYGTRPSPRGEQGEAASGWPCGGGGGARSPRSAGVLLLRPAVTAPAPLPACSPCLPPPACRRGRCRGKARAAAALSLPEPAAASPEKPHVLRAPRRPAALRAVRAADTSHLPTGKRPGGCACGGGLPFAPKLEPACSRHPSRGAEGPGRAGAVRGGADGATRPCPVGRGAGSERGRVGGFFSFYPPAPQPEMEFQAPHRSGLGVPAAAALRAAATHTHTPTLFCLRARLRNTLRAAIACPAGRQPGMARPRRAAAPGLRPPPLHLSPPPGEFPPFCLYFHRSWGFP